VKSSMTSTHPWRDGVRDTTPRHIWLDAVYAMSGASVEDATRYVGRDRLSRMYQAGEPAWMAADAVRQFVHNGKIADRAEGEVESMRRAVRTGIARGSRGGSGGGSKSKAQLDREIEEIVKG